MNTSVNTNNHTDRVYVYIDGFNLYYGILRNRKLPGYKWLNLESLCNKFYSGSGVKFEKIKYFTALVSGKYDPKGPVEQQAYWRALATLPNLELIKGRFLYKKRKIQITQEVELTGMVPEEKGTDVNLATHLVNDAHLKKFDTAIVISNDSDLAEAVRIVGGDMKMRVGVINPCKYQPTSTELVKNAIFQKRVGDRSVLASQFPAIMTDKIGQFQKPYKW